ncbi:MAG: cupin domain-containing protein [Armatimonadota bacterium]|nr:cupin domain-containing protein [Armatimonadota bacterium]MDR7450639.1 cupin domain-containing protein [Armatimonadota bacterium]MDR7466228.1 cupin domain-containing protein [Armatimonadota bacterium]MDR7492949.1 cupin domain-containing protein [Armatimonadota bacterium]MDR7498294.1 cupin domain-containing protein [Armatimonadota bacterium]
MPFFDLDAIQAEYVTPKYSSAFGPLVTGEQIEVGRLRFAAGEGSIRHAHPQEQIVVILRGRVLATLEGQTRELGPGQGFLAPPNAPHEVKALEAAEVLSCKGLVAGRGHRITS